jgi:hypothetical protein
MTTKNDTHHNRVTRLEVFGNVKRVAVAVGEGSIAVSMVDQALRE